MLDTFRIYIYIKDVFSDFGKQDPALVPAFFEDHVDADDM